MTKTEFDKEIETFNAVLTQQRTAALDNNQLAVVWSAGILDQMFCKFVNRLESENFKGDK